MISIFSIPKSFQDDHTNIIQSNAVNSWCQLGNSVQILLIGNDPGIREKCKELNLEHIEAVENNEFGTPLLNSAFSLARKRARHKFLMYVNADIILLPGLLEYWNKLPGSDFLVGGQRWNLDIKHRIDFSLSNWSESLNNQIESEGRLEPPDGIDYFLFPREIFFNLPPFTVGRVGWDNWMIYEARRRGYFMIDATKVIKIIHQTHDYGHLAGGLASRDTNPEGKRNIKLAQGISYHFDLRDANYTLTEEGLIKAPLSWANIKKYFKVAPEILSSQSVFWRMINRFNIIKN